MILVNFPMRCTPAQLAGVAGPPPVPGRSSKRGRVPVALPPRRWPPRSLPPPSRPLSAPAPAFRAVSVRWMCGPAEADMFQARSREEVSLATTMKCEREKSSRCSAPSSGTPERDWGPPIAEVRYGLSAGAGAEPPLRALAAGSALAGSGLCSPVRAGASRAGQPHRMWEPQPRHRLSIPPEQGLLPKPLSSGGRSCAGCGAGEEP